MSLTRAELADRYLEQLPYPPYPVQDEALLAWFMAEQGILVCAPTGTGKTLIAEAALFEALHTGRAAYYTTPLIALTEQKFREMQECAVRWGFNAEDVGLVTGNRRVNSDARILVVVAEILLNRLLHPEAFDFENVFAVVMDEFHNFGDLERGIVWELSLALLPKQVRLLLLSATVGNAFEFMQWLERCHQRKLELVEGRERKIPLTYHWVPDQFLYELLLDISKGDEPTRKTPALVFCFNRDECWSVAEQLKGLDLLWSGQRGQINQVIDKLDWTQGAAPKLRQMLLRGVGVHHAGVLPKYRRVVEDLFQKKLLTVAVCTETLAAGINLPARSVVVTSLLKGPYGKQKLIDPSTIHQIFGRAGRPQFDKEGHVYVLAHEDDVRLLRWKEKYDAIPDTTKDPSLLKAKKDLKRKKPPRKEDNCYWTEGQFERLKGSPPARLYSKGPLPWRLLAYMLKISPDVDKIRSVIRKRLLDSARIAAGEKQLEKMLLALAAGGYVTLDPNPAGSVPSSADKNAHKPAGEQSEPAGSNSSPRYAPIRAATPTERLERLLIFRGVHPLYGAFLIDQLGIASPEERLQALESVLEMPRPLLRLVRVPWDLSPGPLAATRLDADLQQRGLIAVKVPPPPGEQEEEEEEDWEERPPSLAEKLFMLFEALYPDVTDVTVQSVWSAAELLRFNGDFNTYVRNRDLTKQEGIIFRHTLRLILLCDEFSQLTPPDTTAEEWTGWLRDLEARLTAACRKVDPTSTDQIIQTAHAADVVEGETAKKIEIPDVPQVEVLYSANQAPDTDGGFGEGILEEGLQ
ncbi:MAG TPA: DEAD/DEAH box helicase [Gemmataceae bacterium]|nr:DEAD/DEAH box helicase [Gemmataceae bacterium]